MVVRRLASSASKVASRPRDPTFEKLMDGLKNLQKVVSVRELLLADPLAPSLSLDFLRTVSQRLHLNKGPAHFLRKYPHVFDLFYHQPRAQPCFRLTPGAHQLHALEQEAIRATLPDLVARLARLLSMSPTRTVPLRAVFRVHRELGLPDDFEHSVLRRHPDVFGLGPGNEVNTHVLKLLREAGRERLVPAVQEWRDQEHGGGSEADIRKFQYCFKHSFPPGMKLSKGYKKHVRDWQRRKYVGPYDEVQVKREARAGIRDAEKRAVGMVHELLSITVEKKAEVEQITHFRKWFGIAGNIRATILNHPGIFYLSTKGHRHTVFLREAYERGRLIKPNPVYEVRRKLLHLVLMGRRGMITSDAKSNSGQSIFELEKVESMSSEESEESDQSDMDGSEEIENDSE